MAADEGVALDDPAVQAMLREAQQTQQPEPQPQMVPVPADIVTDSGVYEAHTPGSWFFADIGVFAQGGKFRGDEDGIERDLLFPYTQIKYIEYFHEALAALAPDAPPDESDSD